MTRISKYRDSLWPDSIWDRSGDREAVVHVRFAGLCFDLQLASLGLEPTSGDELVKRIIARQLQVHPNRLDDYLIDRHANGNMTLRREADDN